MPSMTLLSFYVEANLVYSIMDTLLIQFGVLNGMHH